MPVCSAGAASVAGALSATCTFVGHRVATDGLVQGWCAVRGASCAEPDGALFSLALRCLAHCSLPPVLWSEPALGALVPGSGTPGPAHWATQYDGVHPPAFECAAGARRLCAYFSRRGCDPAAAPAPLADGCSHPAGLHDGSGDT